VSDEFRDRVALVTGASGGIGRALSLRLAEAGAKVAIHYSTGEDRAEALVAEIGDERCGSYGADLSHPDAPGQLVEAVEETLGPIDVLVANAGMSNPQSYEDVTVEDWDQMMAVNLRAPFLLAQAALGGMRERGFGRILFTSSVAGLTGGIIGPHYAASKSGLHGLTHHLASRVAADGVTVNAIAPALIAETAMLPGDPVELARKVPVQRLGTPAEVADLMVAILDNGYVTNQVISIDGGMYPG
jgi:3-oxoacyl-[acyl-carrier protein] reductase